MYLLKSTYVTFCICPSGHVFNSNPSQNYLSSTPTASYSQTPETQPYALGKRSKHGKPPWKTAEPAGKIGAKVLISMPCPNKQASWPACHSIRRCLQ